MTARTNGGGSDGGARIGEYFCPRCDTRPDCSGNATVGNILAAVEIAFFAARRRRPLVEGCVIDPWLLVVCLDLKRKPEMYHPPARGVHAAPQASAARDAAAPMRRRGTPY